MNIDLTEAEILALPVGTVVRSRDGRSWQRYEPHRVGLYEYHAWMCPDGGLIREGDPPGWLLGGQVLHAEDDLRERIAREIEAEASHYAEPNGLNPQEDGECIGLTRAAEIARGTTRKDTDHA